MCIGLKYKDQRHVFEERIVHGVPFLVYPILERTGLVRHGFSTRLGGVSRGDCASMNTSFHRGDDPQAVEENRRNMVYAQQTHTTHVAVVTERDRGRILNETDGMITDVPGVCLVTFYADCVPLYFVDPVRRVIGLSHSGWRGTVNKMANVTVEKMKREFHSDPADIIAAIGPSICRDCYEVGEDVISQFREHYPRKYWDQIFFQKKDGKYQLDLWKANEYNLMDSGIRPEHMAITNVCTCCNPAILFSHRFTGGKRGNLSAFLALKEQED